MTITNRVARAAGTTGTTGTTTPTRPILVAPLRAFGGTSGVILAIIGIPLLLTFFLCAGCVGCTVLASKVPPPKEEPTFVPAKDNPVNDQKVEPKRQR